jgi:hypothetical protein
MPNTNERDLTGAQLKFQKLWAYGIYTSKLCNHKAGKLCWAIRQMWGMRHWCLEINSRLTPLRIINALPR